MMPQSASAFFAAAARYREELEPAPRAVRERAPEETGFAYSERHLRCVWFDAQWRPPVLQTAQGEAVRVERPGRWNVEAGPDFLDAVLLVGSAERRVAGDVEIHVRPVDWRRHGHDSDPRYARVVAHVTYAPGPAPAGVLPAGVLEISLRDALRANPAFSFEAIDLAGYPYDLPTGDPPCRAALAERSPEELGALLDAAGTERLRRKGQRIAEALREQEARQVFYEETMAALGYKQNSAPFRLLARRVPLAVLREEAGGDVERAYALLCGVASLLPAKSAPGWDAETRAFVRRLWDVWWKRRGDWTALALPRAAWARGALRPQNNPLRRLTAAAALFAADRYEKLLQPASTMEETTRDCVDVLTDLGRGSYWHRRLRWTGPPSAAPVALIGEDRAGAILTNVLLPFWAARGLLDGTRRVWLEQLPIEEDHSRVRETAAILFGHDHNPALYRSGLRRQGLIQIFQDFCLENRSGCRRCALLSMLPTLGRGHPSGDGKSD